MEGQIIRKGERKWLIRVFRGRDEQTGKKKYFNKQIHGNKKDAQKYLNAILRDIDLNIFVEPTRLTVNEYLDQWLQASAKSRVRERTYAWYVELLKSYVRPALGHKKLSDVKPLDVQALYSRLQENGLSPKTVRHVHTTLSTALTQAVRWRMLVLNPALMVKPPRQVRKEMQALSPEEAARFLAAASQDKWGVLFRLALITGMRPEEYLGLQWKDVDLDKGTVTVLRALVWRRKGGGWYFTEPKTPRSRRTIPIHASLAQSMREHRRGQAEQRLKAGPKYQNHDLVFATAEGSPLMPRNLLSRHFKPTLKRAELPNSIRLYDLRHTCATLLLAAGENPKVVSERLGHSSVAMTLDVYSHVLPSMQQAATDKLERLLFSESDTPLTHQTATGNPKAARN